MAETTGKLALVTGITGYIGSHVGVNLLQSGYEVRGTSRSLSKGEALKNALAEKNERASDHLELVVADLSSDTGWEQAMEGVEILHHVASPFPLEEPTDPDEVIKPALEGTRRVILAAKKAGVKRIVVTASVASIMYGHAKDHPQPFTEEHFTNPDAENIFTYVRSKTLAEREAWELAEKHQLALSTIHPGLVLGPLVHDNPGTSVDILRQMLQGKYPGCPRLHFPVVDVRDVADLHRLAGESADAIGHRFACTQESLWVYDLAQMLEQAFPDYAKKLPRREFPDWLIRILSLFDKSIRAVLPELGLKREVSSQKARDLLGWMPRSSSATVRETAQSLIDAGLL